MADRLPRRYSCETDLTGPGHCHVFTTAMLRWLPPLFGGYEFHRVVAPSMGLRRRSVAQAMKGPRSKGSGAIAYCFAWRLVPTARCCYSGLDVRLGSDLPGDVVRAGVDQSLRGDAASCQVRKRQVAVVKTTV